MLCSHSMIHVILYHSTLYYVVLSFRSSVSPPPFCDLPSPFPLPTLPSPPLPSPPSERMLTILFGSSAADVSPTPPRPLRLREGGIQTKTLDLSLPPPLLEAHLTILLIYRPFRNQGKH